MKLEQVSIKNFPFVESGSCGVHGEPKPSLLGKNQLSPHKPSSFVKLSHEEIEAMYNSHNKQLAEHVALDDLGCANRLLECGEESTFWVKRSCKCGDFYVNVKKRCGNKFCLRCGKHRKNRIGRNIQYRLNGLYFDRNYRTRLLTISPKNYSSIREGVKKVGRNLKNFFRNKYLKQRVKGAIAVIQIENKGNGWNVHAHCLLYGLFLDNRPLEEFGGDSPLVYLWKQNYNEEVNIDLRLKDGDHAVSYALGYIMKPCSYKANYEYLADAVRETRGLRLVRTYGEFYNLKLHEKRYYKCMKCEEYFSYMFFDVFDSVISVRDMLAHNEIFLKNRGRPKPPPDLIQTVLTFELEMKGGKE